MSSSHSGGSRRRSHNSKNRPPSRVGKPSAQPTVEKGGKRAAKAYVARRAAPGSKPPRWLMWVLTGCVVVLIAIIMTRLGPPGSASVEPTAEPTPTATPVPTPVPTATPSPTPTPEFTVTPTAAPDYSRPAPLSASADPDAWFSDALFIGDSRADGLRLYSGIKGATFLTSVGLSVYHVMDDEPVIRRGEDMISVLEAVGQKTYGKIYVVLGVNELGYFRPQGFADTMGELVDELRTLQPQATLYIQAILPVNTALCQKYEQRYYITNEAIADYNAALAGMTAEKEVWLLNIPGQLLDQNGEIKEELSADGVHMQRAGYVIWLDYLLGHTGEGEPLPPADEPTVAPTVTPTATPTVKPTAAPMITVTPTATPTAAPEPTPDPTPEPTPEPTPDEPEQTEPSPVATQPAELPPMIINPMAPAPEPTEQEDGET